MFSRRLIFTVLLAAILSFPAGAEAIILLRTADPTANTIEPTGDLAGSGWQYQGTFGDFLGTPIAPHFFITAKHVGGASSKFTFRGGNYTVVRSFDDPSSDLRINEVAEIFPAFAPLYTKSDEVGHRLVVIGRGTQRGAERIVNGQLRGWEWGTSDHLQRWGENNVVSVTPRGGEMLRALFEQAGGTNEAHLSSGDSGGAVFIKDGDVWKLAGINSDVDSFTSGPDRGGPYNAALFDERGSYTEDGTLVTGNVLVPSGFYATRISSRVGWITSIISPRLANISARATVGAGDRVAIAGFIIQGRDGQSKRIIIRGLGPSLQVGGELLAARLSDPVIELYDASGSVIQANDNWRGTQEDEIERIGFAPLDEREAALSQHYPSGAIPRFYEAATGSAGPDWLRCTTWTGPPAALSFTIFLRAPSSASTRTF